MFAWLEFAQEAIGVERGEGVILLPKSLLVTVPKAPAEIADPAGNV